MWFVCGVSGGRGLEEVSVAGLLPGVAVKIHMAVANRVSCN